MVLKQYVAVESSRQFRRVQETSARRRWRNYAGKERTQAMY
jgi:hypothetical protein